MAGPVRCIALWFPDWPVTALRLATGSPPDSAEPVAVVRANTVLACSPAARVEGVRVGQRRRDAQAACPALRIVASDPDRDARGFIPLVKRVEAVAPGVQIIRPGLCLLRARGPARYYGGELEAARVLLDVLATTGAHGALAGVADGPFTAEQAARSLERHDLDDQCDSNQIRVVIPGASAAFLAPLPVTALDDPELASMLARLGVHTLGEFAALDAQRVHDRLSDHGMRLHTLAAGADSRPVTPRVPPPELARTAAFEPPLELADQVAFAVRQSADAFTRALAAVSLVCTEVRIELSDERGGHHERVWLHPACFDAPGIVDRIRWQLQAVWEDADPEGDGAALRGGVASVRISPAAVDAAAHHQPGLFGQGADARLHHALSRVQGMLGHRSVLLPVLGGGRRLREREVLIPWGDRPVLARDRSRPWPGSLPDPLPTTVFTERRPVVVLADDGGDVSVDARGSLNTTPTRLGVGGRVRPIQAWAGPWPLHERVWDQQHALHAYRFQVVTDDETAWLLLRDEQGWSAEGRYD